MIQQPTLWRLIAAGSVLSAAAALCSCSCDTRRFVHDDRTRTYVLHLPQSYDGQDAIPLLVALHGRTGTGAGLARSSGFDELIDDAGFAAAYPDGFKRSWADGRGGSPADQERIDDVGFIDALIDHVGQEVQIDERRVYTVGISNGGMMVQRLACELTHRFAAAASIIGSMPQNLREACHPDEKISVLLMNGTEDPLVPYEGGEVSGDAGGLVVSTPDTIAHWVAHDNCQGAPVNTEYDEEDDNTAIFQEHYGDCDQGHAVDLYQVEGGGHTWPGGPQYLPKGTVGLVSEELVAAEEIWAFFADKRRE